MISANDLLDKHHRLIERINDALDAVLRSPVPLVRDMGRHTVLAEGKRLRPILFVLSCRLCGYRGKDIYLLSTVFEYIHAASLLHDDVLDKAETRRRRPSANFVWGNHAAVLEGDFLYTRALAIALESGNIAFLRRLTDTATRMTEGQILELRHTNDWETDRETYMDIISAKTAALISAACACGAILSGAEAGTVQALERFGRDMGLAFQLIDDVLDYASSEDMLGKPVGKDLREGKVTLPLIYTLECMDPSERERLRRQLEDGRTGEDDHRSLVALVRRHGALERIRKEARSYVEDAVGCLGCFPEGPAKEDLVALNRFITERTY